MNQPEKPSAAPHDLWQGLRPEAAANLKSRDYSESDITERLCTIGVPFGNLLGREGLEDVWIPGVEVFPRRVFHQRGRGYFAEMARTTEGPLQRLGLLPTQWSVARMYSGSAKGFHVHPPHIPQGEQPGPWLRRLYIEEPENFSLRPYEKEQWDVMFFVQGMVEMILVDERETLPRRIMRFVIDGDDLPGPNNGGVVIPAGVAHAVRSCSSTDLIMVYGTTTTFNPSFEGRIASDIEDAPLPEHWEDYLNSG